MHKQTKRFTLIEIFEPCETIAYILPFAFLLRGLLHPCNFIIEILNHAHLSCEKERSSISATCHHYNIPQIYK